MTAHRRYERPEHDAAIAGTFFNLLDMIDGSLDGDALFFSRDLVIEGDTEAVLALRNAIDNEEIDLAREIAALLGPFEGAVVRPARAAAAFAARWTGVALTRPKSSMSK